MRILVIVAMMYAIEVTIPMSTLPSQTITTLIPAVVAAIQVMVVVYIKI
jgi:hypothetical protein